MKAIPLVAMAAIALLVLYLLYASQRHRTEAIRALASRSGLHYLGDALPRSLTLEGTPFSRYSKVWNVIDGEPRGTRIMAFDCRVGVGKRSWDRSVVAVESQDDIFGRLTLHTDLTIGRSGRWQILYRPPAQFRFRATGLTSVEELDALLNLALTNARPPA